MLDSIPTRRSLLGRLQTWEDQESWKEFFDIYRRYIFATALKAGLSEGEAEDVLQETVISVAQKMSTFVYEPKTCSFKTWLTCITRRRIVDQFRKRERNPLQFTKTESNRSDRTALVERLADEKEFAAEDVCDGGWRIHLFGMALESIKESLNPKHYQIFDLYALKGWPVLDVSRTLNVSVALIYITKHRVAGLLRKEVRALEQKYVTRS